MGSVPDTTLDFWAWKDHKLGIYRENHAWRDPKTHFRSDGKALCEAQVPDSRLTKKKSHVDCKACITILKPLFLHCDKCLWAQTCKTCLAKKQVHVNRCALSKGNKNLPYLEFLMSPDPCQSCWDSIAPCCSCAGLVRVNKYGIKVKLNSTTMVLRRNSKDGSLFWGCPNYPYCKKTQPIQYSARML